MKKDTLCQTKLKSFSHMHYQAITQSNTLASSLQTSMQCSTSLRWAQYIEVGGSPSITPNTAGCTGLGRWNTAVKQSGISCVQMSWRLAFDKTVKVDQFPLSVPVDYSGLLVRTWLGRRCYRDPGEEIWKTFTTSTTMHWQSIIIIIVYFFYF